MAAWIVSRHALISTSIDVVFPPLAAASAIFASCSAMFCVKLRIVFSTAFLPEVASCLCIARIAPEDTSVPAASPTAAPARRTPTDAAPPPASVSAVFFQVSDVQSDAKARPTFAAPRASGDDEEALAVANSTPYGLSAGIVTTSLKHATHFKRNSESGLVMVNLPTAGLDYHVPFGGRKQSSYGPREQGAYAKEFYTIVKTAYTQA